MAKRFTSINGFSPRLNQIVNDTIDLANFYINPGVTNMHFFYSLINGIEEFEEEIESEFGEGSFDKINGELLSLFKQASIIKVKANGDTADAEDRDKRMQQIKDLTIDNRTMELDKTFRWLLTNNSGLAEVEDALDYLIHSRESDIPQFLEVCGFKCVTGTNTINYLIGCKTLSKFANDMNYYDRNDKFDPISSRDDIIDQLIEVLGRRQKCNPCIIGDPGVGKTSIIEGLVKRINSGDVPYYLKNKHIINVDISSVVAGSTLRGEFEQRMNNALYEAAKNKDIILFFDEIHMLMEAGGSSTDSTMTASNILKPAINKGDIQIIGATTFGEYKKYVEKDKAFERRLQPITVNEPNVEQAIEMLNKVSDVYCDYHNAKLCNGVIEAAVKLSDRYISDRKLPDKAITVLDSAAAHVKKHMENDDNIIITIDDIIATVSGISGVDIKTLSNEGKDLVKNLPEYLKKHVIGQDEAIESVAKAIRRNKVGINDPDKPIGTFLFVGPTGVGKTELVKALAIEFGGGIKSLIRFDMSEFMEKHSVSRLIGSPPGYVGFGSGGQLTEAVKHNPYSIILFDEIEKAHPDVYNIMLQILDDGQLTDSEGTKVNFRNCTIIMTSNAGYKARVNESHIGFGNHNSSEVDKEKETQEAMKALEKTFKPEFLNRLDRVVVFNSLSKEDNFKIIDLLLSKVADRLAEKHIYVEWDTSVKEMLLEVGFDSRYGARNLKRAIQENIEDTLADRIIDDEITSGDRIVVKYIGDAVVVERKLYADGSEGDKSAESCSVPVRYKQL